MKDKPVESPAVEPDRYPDELEIAFGKGEKRQTLIYHKVTWPVGGQAAGLRHGDNPGQPAALYKLINGNIAIGDVTPLDPSDRLTSDPELLQRGKHPGKTGIRDVDIALDVLRYAGEQPTCIIVKHNNPCGAAQAQTLERAVRRAALANRLGAIGGCAALNQTMTVAAAEALLPVQLNVVAAPDFAPEALAKLAAQPSLCLLRINNIARLNEWRGRPHLDLASLLDGGLIVQWAEIPGAFTRENCRPARATLHGAQEVRCKRQPTPEEWEDLLFAWRLAAAAASDSIVFVKSGATVCIGIAGQDRAAIAQAARDKAYHKLADRLAWERFKAPFAAITEETMRDSIWTDAVELKGGLIGASMASDGALDGPDAIEVAAKEGATAIIQPGGSPNDADLIRLCNEHNIAMVFTGRRIFRH
jgi:phosphoribosylaminoimidazolecarboxamide formyltransferase/IMP cyclohydrolase